MTKDVPLVLGIAPSARTKGAKSPDDQAPFLTQMPFDEALTSIHHTDAHFVTYLPVGMAPGTEFPRCNKPLLGHLRTAGYDLHRTMFALDWDTPEHKPWGETITVKAFESMFINAVKEFPMLGDYACAYYTRSGVRLVYILDETIPVDQSEANLRWFIYNARRAGFMCDELVDWTRLFRLPKVKRDNLRSENDPCFDIEMSPEIRLKTSKLGIASRTDKANIYAVIEELDLDQPEIDESKALLEGMDENGKITPSDWMKRARRRLTGRECFDCIFNHAPMASRGSRNQTMHAFVGQATSLLYYLEDTTPEHIYALFLDAVMQFDEDDGEDWPELLWSSVTRLWAKEDAKFRAREQKAEEDEEERINATDVILDGFRQWADEDPLYSDDFTAQEWASSHLIANIDKSYYLIDHDGYYRPQPYTKDQLVGAIRQHIPDLITTRVEKKDGSGMRDVYANQIINNHTTVVNSVTMQPGVDRGYIEGVDRPNARLIVPGYRLNTNLEPERDDDVAEWLEKLFGPNVDDACRWIAFALAYDEGPICALSIEGEQGAGKKLLAQGLAECLETPALATDADITSDYQYGLLESPFLLVNEGWSKGTSGGKHPADKFRELTSGEPMVVNRRFLHPTTIRNPMRIIFTANNLEVIKKLAHHRELSQADREALAIRLMHFSVGGEASDWLRVKGGMSFTSAPGRRWIAPDAGGRSDYIVAKHFLWLHKNRHNFWKPSERFLVEGHGSQELMFQLQTQVGPAMLVIELIVKMLSHLDKSAKGFDGLHVGESDIFLTSSCLLTYWRNHMSDVARGEKLSLNTISSVLSGIVIPSSRSGPFVLKDDKGERHGRRRWMELDVFKVLDAAERHGFKCERLEKVAKARQLFQKGEPVFNADEEGAV